MADGERSVQLEGLAAVFAGFTIRGDFAFASVPIPGPGAFTQVQATASNVDVGLVITGVVEAGVSGGALALVVNETGNGTTRALIASGGASFAATGFASVSVETLSGSVTLKNK